MRNKIIILGKGFVGNSLIQYFKEKNIDHVAFSKKIFDYSNKEEFKSYLANTRYDIKCVVNCSGYTGVPNVDACEENKELCKKLNVSDPLDVLESCSDFEIPVIHVGSGCIYSGYDKVYDESDSPNFGLFDKDSSFYSKCKDLFEIQSRRYPCYVLRIRIPFSDEFVSKNYFCKLLKYDNLINELNSVTSMTDFNGFVENFIQKMHILPYGFYNVVNPQPIKAESVVDVLKEFGNKNENWKYISLSELDTKAKRSNCVLSTEKIKSFGLELPNTLDSVYRDARQFTANRFKKLTH
jgi:3,5-epimerase/4-reductase